VPEPTFMPPECWKRKPRIVTNAAPLVSEKPAVPEIVAPPIVSAAIVTRAAAVPARFTTIGLLLV
jgi:hypothetical protein